MIDWKEILSHKNKKTRAKFSQSLLDLLEFDCLTRKPRDPVKRDLMRQLGLTEKFTEVQYPSPGNTPPDLDKEEI